MKNFENLGVVELSNVETTEILGGTFWEDAGWVIGYIGGSLHHALTTIEPRVQQRW